MRQQRTPSRTRPVSPAVVHSPLASSSIASSSDAHKKASTCAQMDIMDNIVQSQPQRNHSSRAKSTSRSRRRLASDEVKSSSPTRDAASSSASGSGSLLVSCVSRTLVVMLVLALAIASLTCGALLVALASANKLPTMPHIVDFDDFIRPIRVDPPCAPAWMPPEEPMALPAPIRCRFSFLRLRCVPADYCQTGLHLFPLPHARCSMKPEVYA